VAAAALEHVADRGVAKALLAAGHQHRLHDRGADRVVASLRGFGAPSGKVVPALARCGCS
jgi:hypothetical protein